MDISDKTLVSSYDGAHCQEFSKKTFGNQSILPRLPIPDLHETCDRYLEWLQPLTSKDEFVCARQVVDDFRRPGGIGEKLQKELMKWSQKKDRENWLEPFWDEMYLRSRLPVVDLTWKSRSIDFRDTCPTH